MTISLNQQIEEVERELALRRDVYPRQVAAGKMRQSIADYHLKRMEAVLATLYFVSQNAEAIRAAVASKPAEAA